MRKIKSSVLAICALSTLATAHAGVNKVSNVSKVVNEVIGDKDIQLQVLSEAGLREAALKKSIISISDPAAMKILSSLPQGKAVAESVQRKDLKSKSISKMIDSMKTEESLLVGFPIGLVGEENIFGGVITTVTDKESENLGTLKLTDLPAIHVRTVISRSGSGLVLTLVGCMQNCSEATEPGALLSLPIVGFNQETGMIILDMAEIGKELDLITMLDPNGSYTQLKAISSATTKVEYDMKTLVFDIQTKMVPVTAKTMPASTTDFTVRWYLKLNSGSNPLFVPRAPAPGVGFFQTDKTVDQKITRFSITGDGTSATPVKYYIKNVPEEHKASFGKALDSWNVEFRSLIKKDLLSYEFIDQDDPRAEELIPGDIRYNIIEWDLVNKAGYGGLGPSIANQYSGQTMSANVLIQGPTVVRLYTKWFGVSQEVKKLQGMGLVAEAAKLMKDFNQEIEAEHKARAAAPKFKLKLGKSLEMTVHAQRPELEDPIIKGEFEVVPAGVSYEKYMDGYLQEMVAHEIGHNLGLRHNFKGNLGATETGEKGSVSRSIMEYLGRGFRHLNAIGDYDRMAIAYGYKGVIPQKLNWFCTDEDQGTDAKSLAVKSPECTKSDATSDPFSFWESRLTRALDLLLETKSTNAPVWKAKEIATQIDEAVIGLSAYALSADKTAETWTNFFGKAGRPTNKSEVKAYVLASLKKKICDPALAEVIAAKPEAEAQKIAQDNLNDMTMAVMARTASLGLYNPAEILCE